MTFDTIMPGGNSFNESTKNESIISFIIAYIVSVIVCFNIINIQLISFATSLYLTIITPLVLLKLKILGR